MFSLVFFAALLNHHSAAAAAHADFIPYHVLRPSSGNISRPLPNNIQLIMNSIGDHHEQITLEHGFKRGSRVCVYTQGKGARARASGSISFVGQTIDDIQETIYQQLKTFDVDQAEAFNEKASKISGSAQANFWGENFGAAFATSSNVHSDSEEKTSIVVTDGQENTVKRQMNNITHDIAVHVNVMITSCAFVEVYALTIGDKQSLIVSENPPVGAATDSGTESPTEDGSATTSKTGPPKHFFKSRIKKNLFI